MKTNATPKAKKLWESIPQSDRMRLLNNFWCGHCRKVTSAGNIGLSVEFGDLIIEGECTSCLNKVVRLIEGEGLDPVEKDLGAEPIPHNPDISNLVRFRKDSKSAIAVEQARAIPISSSGTWNPKEEIFDE